jgi:8-oxo-dGTP pyrophosphatase MutT (NUDIX family)
MQLKERGTKRVPSLRNQIETLGARFGRPAEALVEIRRPSHATGPAGFPLSSRRTSEVVLVVPRKSDTVLVHTKNFYPTGIWRLPTGGIRRREPIDAAVRRESLEETGQPLEPVRFLFHLRFRWDGFDKEFHSFGFLMSRAEGKLESLDRREQIAAFRDSDRSDLQSLTQRLESLRGNWTGWGRFRAGPHRALLRLWPKEGFEPFLEDPPPPTETPSSPDPR